MPPKKTKTGEDYSAIYMTSFDVLLMKQSGELFKGKARVKVPKSEATFYSLIYKMAKKGMIPELARLTAEKTCFQEGFRIRA